MKFVKGCLVALLGLWVVLGLIPGSAHAVPLPQSDRIVIGGIGNTLDTTLFDGPLAGESILPFRTGVRTGGPPEIIGQVELCQAGTGPGTGVACALSDLITASIELASEIVIEFCSDFAESSTPCGTLLSPIQIPENGNLQDISIALRTLPFGVLVSVQSDVEPLQPVPGPRTLLMLGLGLAGLVWRRSRRE